MRGYFGIGIEHGKNEFNIGTLWRSADLLGAAFIFTVGRRRYRRQASDTMASWRNIPLWKFESLDDLMTPFDCMLVGVELHEKAVSIESFTHPERCVYLLGAEDHGLTKAALERCHRIVQLPGRHSMNVAAAGTIVLYDRTTKLLRAA